MGAISAAQVVTLTDKAAALWLAALGTEATGYGLGESGATARAYGKAAGLETAILAFADVDLIVRLLGGAQASKAALDTTAAVGKAVQAFMDGLDATCRVAAVASGVNSLDQFAAYYNITHATKWGCLWAPDFRPLYYAWKKTYPTAYNVYFELLQGATYANGLRKLVIPGPTQTAGTDIDITKHAGGFGQVKASGVTGSGVVTVTGVWRKPDGTTYTAAGTATVSGNGTVVLTPPVANALLCTVTDITAAAGITAATIYAEALRPAGRTNPPT